jgi:N-methylhydantoinase A/oxoprolinase/acetone carboxylase beta subunit
VHLARGVPPSTVDVHDRDRLGPADVVTGPAIIDAADTTVWIPAGHAARLDPAGSLVIVKEA